MSQSLEEKNWRERGDAYVAKAKVWMSSNPLTKKELQEAANAYESARVSYERINDGDAQAEMSYQKALIAERWAMFDGPDHYLGANIFYRVAVNNATSKKAYYQDKWDEFKKRRGNFL